MRSWGSHSDDIVESIWNRNGQGDEHFANIYLQHAVCIETYTLWEVWEIILFDFAGTKMNSHLKGAKRSQSIFLKATCAPKEVIHFLDLWLHLNYMVLCRTVCSLILYTYWDNMLIGLLCILLYWVLHHLICNHIEIQQ